MGGAGIDAEELAVGHVGEPGERMPIAGVLVDERPGDAGAGETVGDVAVFVDVIVVIVDDEIEVVDGPIDGKGDGGKEESGEKRAAAVAWNIRHALDCEKSRADAKVFQRMVLGGV